MAPAAPPLLQEVRGLEAAAGPPLPHDAALRPQDGPLVSAWVWTRLLLACLFSSVRQVPDCVSGAGMPASCLKAGWPCMNSGLALCQYI